jgi:hypothetical protein
LLPFGAESFVFQFAIQKYKENDIQHYKLPVVLYGCETWSLTLRKEHRLRVFENRVLRKVFGPKRDEATGEWRRLHNEELHDQQSSPNIIRVIKSRVMRQEGNVAHMGEERGAYRIFVARNESEDQGVDGIILK